MELHYFKETSKFFHIAVLILLLVFVIVDMVIIGDEIKREYLLLIALVALSQVGLGYEGVMLSYRKNKCLTEGEKHEGEIVGKTGHASNRDGYFYRLIIKYGKETMTTPLIKSKYVDRLKSRSCTVWTNGKWAYAEGFELTRKRSDAIEIETVTEKKK